MGRIISIIYVLENTINTLKKKILLNYVKDLENYILFWNNKKEAAEYIDEFDLYKIVRIKQTTLEKLKNELNFKRRLLKGIYLGIKNAITNEVIHLPNMNNKGEIANKIDIEEALCRLKSRKNNDAFVIFAANIGNKFVQFAGSINEDLIFNLPKQALNNSELKKAKKTLLKYGIVYEKWDTFDKPGGKKTGTQEGFYKNLNNDIKKATEIAWAIFKEVYKFEDNFELLIEEN